MTLRAAAMALTVVAVVLAETPQQAWDRVIQAKGGRARLERVTALAIYTSPVPNDPLGGPQSTWLCVFPDRYFNWAGRGFWSYPVVTPQGVETGETPRSVIVDASRRRLQMDASGTPRVSNGAVTPLELDQLVINQVVFPLETRWLKPRLVAFGMKRSGLRRTPVITVQSGARTFEIYINGETYLPDRIHSPAPSNTLKDWTYDWRLSRYGDFYGILLPTRVVCKMGRLDQFNWVVDYEVNPKYNPKLFERAPDLAAGPEPWRK